MNFWTTVLSNSPNKAVIEQNWQWRASPSLSLTDTLTGSLCPIPRKAESVYHCLAVTLYGSCRFLLTLNSQNGSLSQTVEVYSSLLLMFTLLRPCLSPWLSRYHFGDWAEKYFPKQTDSKQNKHLVLGVHAALKESHLSQEKCPWEVMGKKAIGGDPRSEQKSHVRPGLKTEKKFN